MLRKKQLSLIALGLLFFSIVFIDLNTEFEQKIISGRIITLNENSMPFYKPRLLLYKNGKVLKFKIKTDKLYQDLKIIKEGYISITYREDLYTYLLGNSPTLTSYKLDYNQKGFTYE